MPKLLGCLLVGLLGSACNQRQYPGGAKGDDGRTDPDPQDGAFSSNQAIAAASVLQDIAAHSRDVAISQLRHQAVRPDQKRNDFASCRMLFKPRGGSTFRRPDIGRGTFLGGTDAADWPLEPIEIVDGVPFLIVQSYVPPAQPESVSSYVEYCVANCDWNDQYFEPKDRLQKASALDKLKQSSKWKRPLTPGEVQFLQNQAR